MELTSYNNISILELYAEGITTANLPKISKTTRSKLITEVTVSSKVSYKLHNLDRSKILGISFVFIHSQTHKMEY